MNPALADWLDWLCRSQQALRPSCHPPNPRVIMGNYCLHSLRGHQAYKLRFSFLSKKHLTHRTISPTLKCNYQRCRSKCQCLGIEGILSPLELDFSECKLLSAVILWHAKYLQAFVFPPFSLSLSTVIKCCKRKSHTFAHKECAKMGDSVQNILPSLHLPAFSTPLEAFILKTLYV